MLLPPQKPRRQLAVTIGLEHGRMVKAELSVDGTTWELIELMRVRNPDTHSSNRTIWKPGQRTIVGLHDAAAVELFFRELHFEDKAEAFMHRVAEAHANSEGGMLPSVLRTKEK